MKFALATVSALFAVSSAQAATINGARYVAAAQAIEVDVTFGGGCKRPHVFTLKSRGCVESMPVQCSATLVDLTTGDFCEAIVRMKALITLRQAGMDNGYFSQASVVIVGDQGSKAAVRLPVIR